MKTAAAARTMALDPKTHNIYLSVAQVEMLPPAEGDAKGRPRRKVTPGSFGLLEFGRWTAPGARDKISYSN